MGDTFTDDMIERITSVSGAPTAARTAGPSRPEVEQAENADLVSLAD